MWEREADYYVEHAILGHVHRPLATRTTPVPEHPAGVVTLRTEARGFRADTDVAVDKPASTWRVLLVGDSHTDGVVDNADHLASHLRALLTVAAREAGYDGTIDVVNAATGYWGPAQYGAAFGVWSALSADLCLVVLYEGNDFLDAVAAEERAGRLRVARRPDHFDRLLALQDQVGERVSQQLNQDLLFDTDPTAARAALDHTATALARAHRTCAAQAAPLVVARLPPSGAIHPLSPAEAAHVADRLGPIALGSGRTLGGQLTDTLAHSAEGAVVIDLWDDLFRAARGLPVPADLDDPWAAPGRKSAPTRMYWSHDHHLSAAGHATAARTLARAIADHGLLPTARDDRP